MSGTPAGAMESAGAAEIIMANRPRRPTTAMDRAEALFREATTRPVEAAPRRAVVPPGKETVSIRIDRDVLAHFQDDGPGWQDRLNACLRKAVGLE